MKVHILIIILANICILGFFFDDYLIKIIIKLKQKKNIYIAMSFRFLIKILRNSYVRVFSN